MAVSEHPYEVLAHDERLVQLVPASARERDDVHVVVGQAHAVSKGLKGMEGRIDFYLTVRTLSLYGGCQAEEQWVA